jgi:hypothetical protein
VQRHIPSIVSEDDNMMLTTVPSPDNIKLAVFEINGDGVSGPDGFSGHFFQFFWDVVSTDVVNSVQHFFLTGSLHNNIKSNLMVLIPKSTGADRVEIFWPFQFKIITKILADRLAFIVKKIISPHQCGFISDRSIADCVIVASEAINVLSKKCYAGSLGLNIFIWPSFVPPSKSFVVWRCFHNQMPTDENLIKRGCTVVTVGVLCTADGETTPHLFLHCSFGSALWEWLGELFGIHFDSTNFHSIFNCCANSGVPMLET